MSLADKTAALTKSMSTAAAAIKTQLAKKVAAAQAADTALKVGGYLPADLATALDAELSSHAGSGAPNHVVLSSINVYSKTEVSNVLGTRYPLANVPVSRYGELNYLPVGVSGSFEGASTFFGKSFFEARNYPGIVEDDGTFVFLRNGTNGSSYGVYYAYCKNVATTSNLTPTRTTKKYAPSFIPTGYTAGYVAKSDPQGQCIFGRLQDSTATYSSWFLALTHGTFDDSKHTGCLISPTNLPAQVNNCYPEAFVGNSNVYLLFPVYDTTGNVTPNTSPMEWAVYSIPISSIGNGNTVTPTAITGWTVTGFLGQTISSTNLRLANKTISTASSDQPWIYQDPNVSSLSIVPFYPNQMGQNTVSAQQPTSSTCRSRALSEVVAYSGVLGQQVVLNGVFTFTWDPVAKTAQVEAGFRGQNTFTVSNNQVSLTGPCITADRTGYSNANWYTGETTAYHSQGYWLTVVDQAVVDYPCYLTRCKFVNAMGSCYDALATTNTVTARTNSVFNGAYGSAIGGSLMGSFPLPGGKVLVYGAGRNVAGNYTKDLMLATKGTDGYSYKSLYQGTLTGFAPNASRSCLTDLGLNPRNYAPLIAEYSTSTGLTCTGAQYIEGANTTGFVTCDTNLNLSGSTSITAAVLASLKSTILSNAGASAIQAYITVVVPQNASIPPWGIVTLLDSAKTEKLVFAELSITAGARNGAITGMSVVSVSSVLTMANFCTTIDPTNSNYVYTYMGGGVSVYEVSDAWLVGGQTKHFVNRTTWTGTENYRFAIPKSTNRPDWTTLIANPTWTVFESQFMGGIPNYGFGFYDQTATQSDGTTKLVFHPVATTLATFKSWSVPAASNWKVQVSQDVAQGFVVYFTQATPLILNGVSYSLAPINIDLSTIQAAPANSTFYAYVQVSNGVAKYVISTTQIAESQTNMYIGKIVTGASAITTLTMEKVTRIGNYRFSATARGSAMTVSTGLPSQSSAAAWT